MRRMPQFQIAWLFALSMVISCFPREILAGGFTSMLTKAVRQSLFEQEIEDINAVHRIDNHLVRRLIVMPLTDAFRPHQADLMHGKVQYGDKCSLPTSIGRLIFEKRYEVPWLFEVKPVNPRPRPPQTEGEVEDIESTSTGDGKKSRKNILPTRPQLQKAYVSPLDFRSPENYIFLPKWLMKDLNLQPNDLVDISFVRIKLASLVTFQPLTLEWEELLSTVADPKSLLEHEINKYSSLTAGATICIEVKGKEYPIFVKETKAEGDIAVRGVRVQDSDIRTDIDRTVIQALLEEKKQREADELAQKAAADASSAGTKKSKKSAAQRKK